MKKILVILDLAHGGVNPITNLPETPGKRSPIWPDGSQFIEGVGSRSIGKKVFQKAKRKGLNVEFVFAPSEYKDIARSSRVERVNELAKGKEALCISIHSNASTANPLASGHEAHVAVKASEKSVKAANIWLKHQSAKFPGQKNRGIKRKNWDMVYQTECPAVLIELAFYTNFNDCKLLMDNESQEKMADAIVESIEEYQSCLN